MFAYGFGVLGGDSSTLLLTRGTISALRPEEGRLVFDAKVNPGNSGGPLVDGDGRWLGVVVAKTHVGEGLDSLSLAVHGQAVVAWLAQHRVNVAVGSGLPRGEVPPDQQVRASTVRVVAGA